MALTYHIISLVLGISSFAFLLVRGMQSPPGGLHELLLYELHSSHFTGHLGIQKNCLGSNFSGLVAKIRDNCENICRWLYYMLKS